MNIKACLMPILMDIFLLVPIGNPVGEELSSVQLNNSVNKFGSFGVGNLCDVAANAVTQCHSSSFLFPRYVDFWLRVRKRRRTERGGGSPPPDSDPFGSVKSGRIYANLSR